MSGDWQTTTQQWYTIGFNDELDGINETPTNTNRYNQRIYWQGVEDARSTGHLCCWIWIMKPRTEANDGR